MVRSTVSILELKWTGDNKEALETFMSKAKENYEIINNDSKEKNEKKYLLYINSLGGYINNNTTLFILQEKVYIMKSAS